MSEKNNQINSSGAFDNQNPFPDKPFSEDVWERAYRNVGRPFASMDSKTESVTAQMSTPSSAPQKNNTILVSKPAASAKKQTKTSSISYTTVDSTKTCIHEDKPKEEKEESLLDMLNNVSSLEDLIKIAKKVSKSDLFQKPGFWIGAAIVVFYIVNVLSAIFN